MPSWYACGACKKVTMITTERGARCPVCGSENGTVMSQDRVTEAMEAGEIWNLGSKKGSKRKKKPRR